MARPPLPNRPLIFPWPTLRALLVQGTPRREARRARHWLEGNYYQLTPAQLRELFQAGVGLKPDLHLWVGNCLALGDYRARGQPPPPWLKDWANLQRRQRENVVLSRDRVIMLNRLNFGWHEDELRHFHPETLEAAVDDRYRLSPYVARWVTGYLALRDHLRRRPDAHLPLWLCNWCYFQRKQRAVGALHADRVRLLDAIGFEWDGQARVRKFWQRSFNQLKRRCETQSVPFGEVRLSHQLSGWCLRQRRLAARGKLPAELRRQLDQLGFIWDMDAHYRKTWLAKLDEAKAFAAKHGHYQMSRRGYGGKNRELCQFLETQKGRFKELAPWQQEAIRAARIPLAPARDHREKRLAEAREYYRQHGHMRVDPQTTPHLKKLKTWLHRQRKFFHQGHLSPRIKMQLDRMGFIWNPKIHRWDSNLARWKKCWQTNGKIPAPGTMERRALEGWILHVRNGDIRIDSKQRTELDALNFPWNPADYGWCRWNLNLERFKKFRETDGRVPSRGSEERQRLEK